jgi:hypothetical protein
LAQLPPGALVLSQSDDLAAGLISARVVEGARPDVVAAPAQHLYKPVPDAATPGSAEHRVWSAVQGQPDEPNQVVAAVRAHRGWTALEAPTVSIFSAVPWWSDRGTVPLRVAGPSPALQESLPPGAEVDPLIEHWDARLPSAEDRLRLAWGLANDARARVRVYQDAAGALRLLQATTQRVSERAPGPWVALGSLQDRFGDRDAAIASTRRALELQPGRAAALENLALYLARDGTTLAEAEDIARYAVALRPERAKGWVRLAAVLQAKGDTEGSAEARRHADELLK